MFMIRGANQGPVQVRLMKMTWEIDKPGSVRRSAAIIYLAPQLPAASSEQPERTRPRAASHLIGS